MNKARRLEIKQVYANIRYAMNDIQSILTDEQNAYDNMPENLQDTNRGMESEECIDYLSDAIDALDDALKSLDEIV